MYFRILPLFATLLLAACTPDDVMRLFGGLGAPEPPSLQLVLEADAASPALAEAAAVVQRRLDRLGVSGQVEALDANALLVTVSGYSGEFGEIVALVTRPGLVEFADLRSAESVASGWTGMQISTSAHPLSGGRTDPATGAPFPTILDRVQVIGAEALENQFLPGTWDIDLTFSPEHGALLADYTLANIGTTFGILIDGELLTAPRIQGEVGARAALSGDFDALEAASLAAIIGGGTLPVALTLAEVR